MSQVVVQDLQSLIQDIDEALAWLETRGIEPRRTRFGEYRRGLATVLKHRIAGTLDKLPAIVSREQYRIAFIESARLVEVAKAFKRVPGPRFRAKVKGAAAGPAHPLHEKKSGSKARDFLFELSTAAFFRRRKLPVLAWTEKDGIARVAGLTVLIECKRPQSTSKLPRAIEEATEQLIKHFQRYRRGIVRHGIIALDISVLVNPQAAYLVADSDAAIISEVNALFDRFQAEFRSALGYHRDERILGILLFAKFLVYQPSTNRHINVDKFGACLHARPGTYRAALAEKFYNALITENCRR